MFESCLQLARRGTEPNLRCVQVPLVPQNVSGVLENSGFHICACLHSSLKVPNHIFRFFNRVLIAHLSSQDPLVHDVHESG